MFSIESGSLTPSGLAFTRNPIRLQRHSSDPGGVKAYPFTVSLAGEVFFKGRFDYPADIDLSGIVDGYASYFRDAESTGDPLIEIADEAVLRENEVRIICNGADDFQGGFIALPGGVSRQNLKKVPRQSDIFEERFLNPAANFFLTTRTSGWRLVVKETELYPLYFIVDAATALKIEEPEAGASLTVNTGAAGVFALDLEALRQKFWKQEFILPNVFDVHRGENHICRIVIGQAPESPQRYWLKFRNSLGVFELIELTGEATIAPSWEDAEDVVSKVYDSTAHMYSSSRDRLEVSRRITVGTGNKTPDEARFLLDAIGSEEVYLLGLTYGPLKVIPSLENLTIQPAGADPQQFSIILDIAENEVNILEEIAAPADACKPRIFSDQFNDKFN